MPTLAERLSLEVSKGYNTEVKYVQKKKKEIEQVEKNQILRKINTLARKPTRLYVNSNLKNQNTQVYQTQRVEDSS